MLGYPVKRPSVKELDVQFPNYLVLSKSVERNAKLNDRRKLCSNIY